MSSFPFAKRWLVLFPWGIGIACGTGESSLGTPAAPSNTGGGATVTGGAAPTGGTDSGGGPGGEASGGRQGSGGDSDRNAGGSTGDGGSIDSEGGSGGASMGSGAARGSGGEIDTGPVEPAVEKMGESLLTASGLQVISYGGYLNGESFQQDGLVTHGSIQYAAFWNESRHVVLAGRTLPDGAWSSLQLTDYQNQADDAHNTISIGISPGDQTLHLAFDHHDDTLHYRRSVVGFLDIPPEHWQASDFGNVTSSLNGGAAISSVTYPRFVTSPSGDSLLLILRLGASGNGTSHLYVYETPSGKWVSRGAIIDGSSVDQNPYLHGVAFSLDDERLHFSWCTRATPDATTNHDLFYAYSDDYGLSFFDNGDQPAGTATSDPLGAVDPALRVWEIPQDRGLINQEHMIVSPNGEVHVLLSHMPDDQESDSNFTSARAKSEFFTYHRSTDGTWSRTRLGAFVIANFRGSLARTTAGNLYAVLPDLRIFGSAKASNYAEFRELTRDAGRFFSDPLVDTARLRQEDVLSIFYPVKDSGQIYVLDYRLD